jgi:predicted enzyme related to lactoylglutathione lyase
VLFAGVATAELEAAMPWYEALLGRPADIVVNVDEVMWRICEGGWLYLVRDAGRAGHGLVTVAVADLDRALADITERGLDVPAIETIEGAGRKASFGDPERNTIALIEVFSQDRTSGMAGTARRAVTG